MARLSCPAAPILLLTFAALGCGTAASSPVPRSAPAADSDQVASPGFASATAFVQHLANLAASGDTRALDEAVDAEFATRLPSGDDLVSLFRATPGGCEPAMSEGPGYASIAIPPPMVDDTEEEAALIDALIDELRATTEVDAYCTVVSPEGGEETLMLYTIAVRRGATGWRALAWRDHRLD